MVRYDIVSCAVMCDRLHTPNAIHYIIHAMQNNAKYAKQFNADTTITNTMQLSAKKITLQFVYAKQLHLLLIIPILNLF